MSQIEGRRPVSEALRAGRPIRKILLAEGASLGEIETAAASRGVPVARVARREIDRIARSRSPQGVVALVPEFRYATMDDALALAAQRNQAPLLVALDGITDPQNVGALARSAEAAGAHGLIIPGSRSAGVTPGAEKAAAGALAWLPVVRVTNLSRALADLRERGVWIVALDASGEGSLWELELASEALCLVVGAEGKGVSRLVRERSDAAVAIRLSGRVSSLNASVAGGVALFEVVRRRREAGSAP